MKRSKFSEEQVAYALRQVEAGTPVARIEAWRLDYNQRRPHGSLGYLTHPWATSASVYYPVERLILSKR